MRHLPNQGKSSVFSAMSENGKEATSIGSVLSQTHKTLYGLVLNTLCIEAETSQNWCSHYEYGPNR